MEPKLLHPGAVLENGATLEGGAIFSFTLIQLCGVRTDLAVTEIVTLLDALCHNVK